MNLTSKFLAFTLLGAEWVLWLLIILSVVSVAIMIERAWFFAKNRFDVRTLAGELRKLIQAGDIEKARARLRDTNSVEGSIAESGLAEYANGVDAVIEGLQEGKARERVKLERNLAFLGTLGNNAPFIGLFGTVLGIIKAFHDLAGNQAGGVTVVMAGISEALVATAVGLLVAIPAVVTFNIFNRRVRATMARADELLHSLLKHLRSENFAAENKSAAAAKKSAAEAR